MPRHQSVACNLLQITEKVFEFECSMAISEVTEKILAAKKEKGVSFADLEKIVGRDEVWIASVVYRQASASQEEANKITSALDLPPYIAEVLTEYPVKGSLE